VIDTIGADAFASAAHGVDRTRSGVLFIDHVRRVAARLRRDPDPYAVPAALLHDVVEKTRMDWSDLRAAGADMRMLEVIDALTERDGEPLETFFQRCVADPLALRIKRVDITDKLALLAEGLVWHDRVAEVRSSAQQRLALLERFAPPDAAMWMPPWRSCDGIASPRARGKTALRVGRGEERHHTVVRVFAETAASRCEREQLNEQCHGD
jgi:hypothetical protein